MFLIIFIVVQTGIWLPISNTSLNTSFISSVQALVNYRLGVVGPKEYLSGFPVPSDNNKDTIQVRCSVNGIPYRYSSSYGAAYLVEERNIFILSGSFIAIFPAGNSSIVLEWKKNGNLVQKWMLIEPSTGGLGTTFSISLLADNQNIWYTHENKDMILTNVGIWSAVTAPLSFNLTSRSNITVGYEFNVLPRLLGVVKDRLQEFVSARLAINGN